MMIRIAPTRNPRPQAQAMGLLNRYGDSFGARSTSLNSHPSVIRRILAFSGVALSRARGEFAIILPSVAPAVATVTPEDNAAYEPWRSPFPSPSGTKPTHPWNSHDGSPGGRLRNPEFLDTKADQPLSHAQARVRVGCAQVRRAAGTHQPLRDGPEFRWSPENFSELHPLTSSDSRGVIHRKPLTSPRAYCPCNTGCNEDCRDYDQQKGQIWNRRMNDNRY